MLWFSEQPFLVRVGGEIYEENVLSLSYIINFFFSQIVYII